MNLFELFVKIGVDDQASGALSKISSGLGKGIATAAKIGTAAVGAASAGITALTTAAVNNYAEYEQLVGGVETLFKQSADVVQQYAANAYKTAGMSANEYMETVTSFSASLLQSLDGDTAAASEKANLAITDMSDNANKMGTSMEMIQNAYQGFAKQNYTMLDNLKLGYGGTKSEMERLLQDAEALSDSFNLQKDASGDLVYSYADIVDAIHIVQTEMGITGTTAKEASSTISGSIASMESTWTNLVVGIADDNADLDALIGNFVDSVETAGKNIIPRIETILGGIGTLVTKLSPIISQEVPALVHKVLPSMLNAGIQLLGGVIQGLIGAFPSLVSAAKMAVPMLIDGIATAIPQLMSAGGAIIEFLVNGIVNNGPQLLQSGVDTAVGLIDGLSSGLSQAVPQFLGQALPMLLEFTGQLRENAGQLVDAGLNLILELGNGLIAGLPTMIQTIPTIVSNIAGIINDNAPKLLATAATLIWNLASGLIQSIPLLMQEAPKIIGAIADVITAFNWLNLGKNILKGISDGVKSLPGKLKELARNAVTNIKNSFQNGGIGGVVSRIINSVKGFFTSGFNAIKRTVSGAINGVKSVISGGLNGAKSVVSNILGSIKSKFSSIFNGVKNIVKAAIDKVKGIMKFSWSLPKLKLPHFSIKGKFSLDPPSVPYLSISWYKKAMSNAMLLNSPTIFGMSGNTFLGAGEAGPEVVAGADTLMGMMRSAVDRSLNSGLEQVNDNFERLFAIMGQYYPQFASCGVYLDSDRMVGQMAPAMDVALGKLATARRRGR